MARTKVSQLPRIDDRSQLTADDLILVNDGNTTKTIPAQILSNRGGTGYTHTGAFAGKPVDNSYVWEAGEGICIYFVDTNTNSISKTMSNPIGVNKLREELLIE